MLLTEERQPFINDLQAAIKASGIGPFTVDFSCLNWVSNHEKNRWFLVAQVQKPPGDGLNKLLEASNEVAGKHEQPCLYVSQEVTVASSPRHSAHRARGSSSKRRKSFAHSGPSDSFQRPRLYEDASAHFHVSIGWTLEKPCEASPIEEVIKQGLGINIRAIKVKVGNGLAVIALASELTESNGIIGL